MFQKKRNFIEAFGNDNELKKFNESLIFNNNKK